MRYHLAARYPRRVELCGYREQLLSIGDTVTSRWLAFFRFFGLHKPDQTPCGQPVSVAEAHALMDLEFGPMRQGELAVRLQLEKSTVSRLVRQMDAHGWIQRNSIALMAVQSSFG